MPNRLLCAAAMLLAVIAVPAAPVYAESAARTPKIVAAKKTAKSAVKSKTKPVKQAAAKAKKSATVKTAATPAPVLQAPPVPGNIIAKAEAAGGFKTLVKLLKAAGFTPMLLTQGQYTLFAPGDQAFARLSEAQLGHLQKPENRAQLVQILGHHIVGGRKLSRQDLQAMRASPKTMAGQSLALTYADGKQRVDAANITDKPIQAANGVIHAVDLLLVPMPMIATAPPAAQPEGNVVTARANGGMNAPPRHEVQTPPQKSAE